MRTRLTMGQVREIRSLLAQTRPRLTYAQIAARYGVSDSLIGQICRGEIACYADPEDDSLDDYLDSLDDEPEVTVELPEDDDPELEVGDVVRLRSGSPPMVVERALDYTPETHHPYVTVSYWTDDGVTSARVHPDAVERVTR